MAVGLSVGETDPAIYLDIILGTDSAVSLGIGIIDLSHFFVL
jgi:hypothetical protein